MNPESSSPPSRGYRFPADLPAVVFCGGREHACRAHNLSRTGVLLAGHFPAPASDEIEFAIRTPAGDLEQRFSGRVVRFEPAGEAGEVRLAVELRPLDPEQQRALERMVARVMEGLAPAPLEALRPGAPPQEVRTALDAVPVPHRIALAARAGPREREFLRQDTHPAVLEALARNPNILLAEVRSLLAGVHLLPTTLEVLAADPRWSKDEEIRILIGAHPRTPLPLAERILAGLPAPALKRMLTRASLNPALRDRIVKRLARG